MRLLLPLFLAASILSGQQPLVWQSQTSGSTASLRGIHAVTDQIAWASGTAGTVLRTTDGGVHWLACATPDATLDFRGIQAFDASTAIVMSSGPGPLSRLYKTTDACHSWQLLLQNTDPDGFFDSFWLNDPHGEGLLLGDPTQSSFTVLRTVDGGLHWQRDAHPGLELGKRQLGAFAASNQCIPRHGNYHLDAFVAGGISGAAYFSRNPGQPSTPWQSVLLPLAGGVEASGPFAVAARPASRLGLCYRCPPLPPDALVAVGGNYTQPNAINGTAARSTDLGRTWTAAATPPHGYRSSVQWSSTLKLWITVGTNGSDFSTDDGLHWQSFDNANWNALSLPFVVGPHGAIARLR